MTIEVRLLGRFEVDVDGVRVAADAWKRRAAADLVKLLALTPGRQLHRERVIHALWPDVAVDDAAPRLHKAAHYARRALGRDDAVVLRPDAVALLREADLTVDVFERAAEAAEDVAAAGRALDLYGGELLPDDPYAPWAASDRDRVRSRYEGLLRTAQRWADLLALDPTDESAHVALMQEYARTGDRRAALRLSRAGRCCSPAPPARARRLCSTAPRPRRPRAAGAPAAAAPRG